MRDESKRFDVSVEVNVSADDVVNSLSQRDLVDFIIALDARSQDWGVTIPLCDHFDKLRKEYEAEEKADAAKKAVSP